MEGWVIFVTGLHEESQEEDVLDAFSDVGTVSACSVDLDRRTGLVKGHALVEYEKYEEAEAAVAEMNGAKILGKEIAVDWAFVKDAERRGGGYVAATERARARAVPPWPAGRLTRARWCAGAGGAAEHAAAGGADTAAKWGSMHAVAAPYSRFPFANTLSGSSVALTPRRTRMPVSPTAAAIHCLRCLPTPWWCDSEPPCASISSRAAASTSVNTRTGSFRPRLTKPK